MKPLIVAVATVSALVSVRAQAGAWLRSESESLFSTRVEYATADRFWDQDRRVQDLGCDYSSYVLSNYYEYGYSYYYTLFGELSLGKQSCGANSASGVEDLVLGIRGRLNPYRNGRAWEAMVILPTGGSRSGSLHVGNEEFGFQFGVARRDTFGPEVESQSGSIEYGISVRLWTGEDPTEVLTYLKGSYAFGPRWSFSGRLTASWTVGSGRLIGFASGEGGGGSEYKLLRLSVDLAHKLNDKWRMTIGAFRHLKGENVVRSGGVNVAFSRLWR